MSSYVSDGLGERGTGSEGEAGRDIVFLILKAGLPMQGQIFKLQYNVYVRSTETEVRNLEGLSR